MRKKYENLIAVNSKMENSALGENQHFLQFTYHPENAKVVFSQTFFHFDFFKIQILLIFQRLPVFFSYSFFSSILFQVLETTNPFWLYGDYAKAEVRLPFTF